MFHKGFEIIHDIPSEVFKPTEKKYVELIKKAKEKIMIETPYLIPSLRIRRAFFKAVKRGIKIIIIIPYISDMKIVDIFRNYYLGELYKKGIRYPIPYWGNQCDPVKGGGVPPAYMEIFKEK
jgi:cardiolipin synthase